MIKGFMKFLCLMVVIMMLALTAGTVFAAETTEFEKKVIDSTDLNSEEAGVLSDTKFGADWSLSNPAGDSPELAEENGNRFARIQGYSQIVSPYVAENGDMYEFSAKIRTHSSSQTDVDFLTTVIFRATTPVLRSNPKAEGSTPDNPSKMNIEFYESDWYKAFFNKGEEHMGGSGIGIMLRADAIRVYIRTHIDGALHLGAAYHEFNYPDGVNQGDFIQITVTDNGNDKVEIYVNGNMITSISFSDQDYYGDDSEDSNDYYKTAAMSDPSGNNLDLYDSEGKKIETENNVIHNAMISAMESYTAFATRNGGILDVDDISISELTEQNTATEAPETSDGDKSTPDISATETPGPATANAASASSGSSDSSDSSSPVIPIVITAICVVIVAAVVIYFCIKRKK